MGILKVKPVKVVRTATIEGMAGPVEQVQIVGRFDSEAEARGAIETRLAITENDASIGFTRQGDSVVQIIAEGVEAHRETYTIEVG